MKSLGILTSLIIAGTSCASAQSKHPVSSSSAPVKPAATKLPTEAFQPWGLNEKFDTMRLDAIVNVIRNNILFNIRACAAMDESAYPASTCNDQFWREEYEAVLIAHMIPPAVRQKIIKRAFDLIGRE